MSQAIQSLHELGQSLWYDNIERRLLLNGHLRALIEGGEIRGVTSNPSIFRKAIGESDDYNADLRSLALEGRTTGEIYERLVVDDIRAAADLFLPLYEASRAEDGYVSLEVNPHLAHDTLGTAAEAHRLWSLVDRPNLMVKIPATRAGLQAITDCIASGVNINVTLIFSLARHAEVMAAYLAGLEIRRGRGEPIDRVASVASFFVSRVDTKVDRWLEAIVRGEGPHADLAAGLMGKLAVANARLAYQQFRRVFGGEAFRELSELGGQPQRPLWASTSTKNPRYSDVKYVEELIGPQTVNTVPQETLDAFRDHGKTQATLEHGLETARAALQSLDAVGISMQTVTDELEAEGVQAFARAYDDLLASIDARRLQVTS